jgi:hypothetical protein
VTLARAAAVVVAVCALSACGDRDTRPATTAAAPTHLTAPEYRRQATAICRRANAQLRGLAQPRSPSELREYVGRAQPVLARAVSDLDELDAPPSLDRAHARWLVKNRQALATLGELRSAGVIEALTRTRELVALNADAARIARTQLGLPTCAVG